MSAVNDPATSAVPSAPVLPNAQVLAPSQTVAWNNGWIIGAGIDVVTGRYTASPFDSVETEPNATKLSFSEEERLLLIEDHTARSYESLISAVAMADVLNLPPIDFRLGAGAEWTKSVRVSGTHATYLVWYRSLSGVRQVDVRNFRLRKSAKDLALKEPDVFRRRYGDYFVEQQLIGWSFAAVVTVRTESTSAMKAFLSFLKATASVKLDASLAVKVDQELATQNVHIEVLIRTSGVEGNDTSGKDPQPATDNLHSFHQILASLEWHKRHAVPAPLAAHIRHYSFLEDLEDMPLSLPLAKQVFDEIGDIRRLVFSCRTLCDALPDTERGDDSLKELRVEVDYLISNCVNDQTLFPSNTDARARRRAELRKLIAHMSEIIGVYAVFKQVEDFRDAEPTGRTFEHRDTWSYGLTTLHTTEHVTIKEGPKVTVQAPSIRRRLAEPKLADNQHVVGFQVRPSNEHGTWRRQRAIVLGRDPAISCAGKSSGALTLSWCSITFVLFVVENNPIFDMFYRRSEKPDQTSFNSKDAERQQQLQVQ